MHPDRGELLDLRRGELEPGRAEEVRRHLAGCEACRREWAALEALEDRLGEWSDEKLPESVVTGVMAAVAETPGPGAAGQPGRARTVGYWLARAALVVLVVGGTLLFQLTVWSPLPATANINATFTLTGAETGLLGWTVPDSVLVLLVFPGDRYGTPGLEGTWELDDLISRLQGFPGIAELTKLVLRAGEPGTPVTVEQDDLAPLLEAFDIPEITVEEGVQYVIGRDRIAARISDRLMNRLLVGPKVEVMVRPRTWTIRGDSSEVGWHYLVSDSLVAATRLPVELTLRSGVSLRAVRDSLGTIRIEPHVVLQTTPEHMLIGVARGDEESLVLRIEEGDRVRIERAEVALDDLPILFKVFKIGEGADAVRIVIGGEEGSEDRIILLLEEAGIVHYIIERDGKVIRKR